MKTIQKNIENEIIIKNSRFITELIKIKEESEVIEKLQQVKEQYPKATHYCYAYKIHEKTKSSDDNEPTGTAGAPILNVIEKENLNNLLIVVIRYFGGIKLGAGGLIRAYTKSVTEALKQATYQELTKGYKVRLHLNYSEEKQIMRWLKKENILEKDYQDTITLVIIITEEEKEKISFYQHEFLEEITIEKSS